MLRRSYPEVGKRGIGVGYPQGVNLVFDAEQMRLAMIWKGMDIETRLVIEGNHDHFTVLDAMKNSDSALKHEILAQS